MIEKKPFVKYNLDQKTDSFTVRLNPEERDLLDKCKRILEQPKDSTAFKQLARIGAKVLHDQKTEFIIKTVFDNKRKNKRLGIIDFE